MSGFPCPTGAGEGMLKMRLAASSLRRPAGPMRDVLACGIGGPACAGRRRSSLRPWLECWLGIGLAAILQPMTTRSTTDNRTHIRAARVRDITFLSRLHVQALPHGFFPRLGLGFLDLYYQGFVTSPHAVALVAQVEGRHVGFVVGTTDNVAHYRWVTRRLGVRLAVRAALALLRRPGLLIWFLRTRGRRYLVATARRVRPAAPEIGVSERVGVLTHIAVVPRARGSGIGQRLVVRFVEAASQRNVPLEAVTLAGEQGASGFWRRLDWKPVEVVTRDGLAFERFRLDVP